MRRSPAWAAICAVAFVAVWPLGSVLAKTVITLWTLPHLTPETVSPFGAGMKAAVEAFATSHPDIELQVSEGADLNKLLTAIAGGAAPDVAIVDRFLLASLARKGYFLPVDQWVKGSRIIRPENMPPGAWEELHGFDGKLYGVPMLADNVGFWSLYYNTRLFSEAGIDLVHAPYSWDEFRAASRKLTRRNAAGEMTQLGYQPDTLDIHNFGRANQAAFVSADGRRVTLNSPKVVGTLEFLADQVQETGGWGEIASSPAFAGGAGFLNGTVAMRSHGEWFLWDLVKRTDLEYSVGFIPTPTGDQFAAWIGGWSWAVPLGAKHPRESVQVIEFLAGQEFARAFIEGAQGQVAAETVVLPGALYFTYPDLVRRLHAPQLVRTAPAAARVLEHFLTARSRVYRAYSRERTPIQQEVWDATLKAYTEAVLNRSAPPRVILDDLTRTLQSQLDEAWVR